MGPEDFEAFAQRLLDLQVEGEILRLPEKGWAIPQNTQYRVGTVRLSRRGDAFITLAKPDREAEIHLRPDAIRDAMEGDVALVQVLGGPRGGNAKRPGRRRGSRYRSGGRPGSMLREGRVVEVVRRKKELVRGQFWAAGEGSRAGKPVAGFVRTLRPKSLTEIYVAPGNSLGARDGDKVLVRLLDQPPYGIHPQGRVEVRIEEEGSLEADFQVIAAEFGFPLDHPAEALAEAEGLSEGIDSPVLQVRTDLRGLNTFTIDPEDSKDFDDAVSLEERPEGVLRLGVHIADVSHYVPSGSALDRSAALRGTSIYLPGRVVPMLPERLSNCLASLQPGQDRLTKTIFLDFSSDGEPVGIQIIRSLIRSRRRFNYEEVLAILDAIDRRRGRPLPERAVYPRDRRGAAEKEPLSLPEDAEEYFATFSRMADLRDALWRRRRRCGALDLDIPRIRLQIGPRGEVLSIGRDERDPSRHLIEEFMIAANEAVAQYFGANNIPLLSRIHPPPPEDRLQDFFFFLKQSGFSSLGSGDGSRDLQRIVEATGGEALAPVIHLALLRSLAHAEYAPLPAIHFALASAAYCHFTSPIRRYPDLLAHQALDEWIQGELRSADRRLAWEEVLPHHAAMSSCAERRAEEAEREMNKLRLIRHLLPRLGEEMEGLVVSVHPFGFFVREEGTLIEGLVHVATLEDDIYEYSEDSLCLRGRMRRRMFRVGDRVRVVLSDLDPDFREISFRLVRRSAPWKSGMGGRKRS